MLVTTKQMFEKAQQEHYAIVAPDYFDNNSARVYVKTAERLNQPVILSYAEAFENTMSLEEAAIIGRYYAETSENEVALHLDHGMHFETIKKAIAYGFTSVMIDASAEDFEENVRRTKEVVDYAHQYGVVVEAEIGHVGQAASEVNDSIYTEVGMAKEFVERTGVDSLAVSIGTAHGKYKGTPVINFERLHELKEALNVPLVLHGGSSSGDENLERCATEGISKINIFTDFITAAYDVSRNSTDWLSMIADSSKAMEEVLEHYYHVFHCDK